MWLQKGEIENMTLQKMLTWGLVMLLVMSVLAGAGSHLIGDSKGCNRGKKDTTYSKGGEKLRGSNWDLTTVDSEESVGSYTSLALDSGDEPHISYNDYISKFKSNLKYAEWTGSGWNVETVDSGGVVGGYTSIALDSGDYPHISYKDVSNGDLKYATVSKKLMTSGPSDQTEAYSGNYTYTFTVQNKGTTDDTYDLSVSSSDTNWSASLSKNTISVNTSNSKSINVMVNIPSNASDGDYSDIKLTATSQKDTSVSHSYSMKLTLSINNSPNPPSNPSPSDGATGVRTSLKLGVKVSDPDGDTMDVTFYEASDGSVIGTNTGVADGGTASVTWSGLSQGTTYDWHAVAEDGYVETQSSNWSFTTNNVPDKPTDPSPLDDESDVSTETTLSVIVSDSDGDSIDVTFHDASDDSVIGTETGVANGNRASVTWSDGGGAHV